MQIFSVAFHPLDIYNIICTSSDIYLLTIYTHEETTSTTNPTQTHMVRQHHSNI